MRFLNMQVRVLGSHGIEGTSGCLKCSTRAPADSPPAARPIAQCGEFPRKFIFLIDPSIGTLSATQLRMPMFVYPISVPLCSP